jgi:hypothetical protein
MRSIHDNNVYAYVVDCEHQRIVLYTSDEDDESPEFTDVVFRGVVAHYFEHVLQGNILRAVEEVEPHTIVGDFAELLSDSWRYGWPYVKYNGDLSVLQDWLRANSIRAFEVQSSYGLSGWVLAESCEFVSRAERFCAV